VIAANAGALAELVTADTGMLVPPRDAAALAAAIGALYDRDIEQLGRQARRMVETCYSWDIVLRSLTACYSQLANRGPVSASQSYAAR